MAKKINWSSIQIDGISMNDYPDFCDAFACYAEFEDGTQLTDAELDTLNDWMPEELVEAIQEAGIDAQADAGDRAYDEYKEGMWE